MSELDLETTFLSARQVLGRVLTLARRTAQRWQVLVVAVALGMVAAYFAPRLRPPLYETNAVLMYSKTMATESLLGWQREQDDWPVRSTQYVDAVLARSTLEKIIGDLQLYPKILERDGLVAAVEEMRRFTSVEATKGHLIAITFIHPDPKVALQVVERLVAETKAQPQRGAAGTAEATRGFLETQLQQVTQDLNAKESALATFLTEHPEFALDDPAGGASVGATIRAQERKLPGSGDSRVAALRRQRERLERRLNAPVTTQSAPVAAELSPEQRQRIDQAEGEVNRLQVQLQDLRARFTDLHPDIVETQSRLSAAKAKLMALRESSRPAQAAVAAAPAQADDEVAKAKMREELQRLQGAIDKQKKEAAPTKGLSNEAEQVVDLETRWVVLNREVDSARVHHSEIETQLFRARTLAEVASSGGDGQITTVDEPFLPNRPAYRGPLRTAAFAFIAVLALGVLVAFSLVLLDDRIYDLYDVRTLKVGPIVHQVPNFDREDDL